LGIGLFEFSGFASNFEFRILVHEARWLVTNDGSLSSFKPMKRTLWLLIVLGLTGFHHLPAPAQAAANATEYKKAAGPLAVEVVRYDWLATTRQW
jgi:hypothetical protein